MLSQPPTVVPLPTSQPANSGLIGQIMQSLGINENPYFGAGFGLMAIGFALSNVGKAFRFGASSLQRQLLVTVELKKNDPSYKYLLIWLSAQQKVAATAPQRIRFMRSRQLSVETVGDESTNEVQFNLVAGQGTHWFKYEHAFILMKKERETRAVNITTGEPWETVTLTTISQHRDIFPRLLSEARSLTIKQQQGKQLTYTAWNTEWRPFGDPRPARALNSVVLAPGKSESIYADVNSFMRSRQWYVDRGIPYRRGYLLHGPPGSGKTSFIRALAGAFKYHISIVHLSTRGMGDQQFDLLLAKVPPKSFVLIEDIDAAFSKRVQTSEDGYQSGVTFSGVLNALDGVTSGDERILFMTTNHIEKLDPALIRPGRIDVIERFDDAVPEQVYSHCVLFFGKESHDVGTALAELVGKEMSAGRRISMAELQGLFIASKNVDDVLEACRVKFKYRYNIGS